MGEAEELLVEPAAIVEARVLGDTGNGPVGMLLHQLLGILHTLSDAPGAEVLTLCLLEILVELVGGNP